MLFLENFLHNKVDTMINLDLLLQAIRKNKEDFKEYTRYIFNFINN